MKKISLLLVCVILVMSVVGCSKGEVNEQGYYNEINVYNWGDYVDMQVIEDFEKEYGIKVNYETYGDNEEMLAKVQSGGSDYDVVFPSDYMIEAMTKEGLLQELDHKNLPNFKNIDEDLKDMSYDPGNKYSVPYFFGTIGILYNTEMVKENVDSWDILWDEKYAKNIIMINSPRDSIGISLKRLGYSMNTKNIDELEKAKEELIKQKPLVKAYAIDDYKNMMLAGEGALALVWSGEATMLAEENDYLEYAIPKEGTNLWFDCIAIPTTSKHKKEAELFINYMMRPEVAAKCAEYIGYATANKEGKKLLPEDMQNNKVRYPEGDILKQGEVFTDLGEFTVEYDRIWTEIKVQ
ncbi:ABC transporter substrate-binding protein [Anaeromicrobium sediminis]|uniref:Spermidine/putrescine ABC transporter substrate-binding protein n=1 Tax=Anaeromicrobium sediminis TaxID=1478221 RepID=A0A267MER6_9FIRM|nr:spermidine/putrescine ABC transporter substrate-binding protein [Anaeromicrobium sediminis]PAB57418.1 spermidine/putrescine ABC transporter substrate-binding protein [Anaeromicrobium sediminis]